MSQPVGSIRAELSEAVACGIRRRGSDAVGLLIVELARIIAGFVRLAAGVAALAVLFGVGALLGYDVTGVHLAGLTGISALVTWLSAGRMR